MSSPEPDLFAERIYPERPGYKSHGPSETAARQVAPRSKTDREDCYRLILQSGANGMTADEAANLLKIDFMRTRPRFSELGSDKHGRTPEIKDSGRTRPSRSGNPQTVWIAT